MKKLRDWLEPRYTKIAAYTIVSAVLIFAICLLIYSSNAAIQRTFVLVGAVIKPLILGMVIAYLLLPLVRILENKVFGRLSGKKLRRNISVILIFVLVAAGLAAVITILVITVTRSISSISVSDLQSFLNTLEKDFTEFWNVIEKKLAEMDISLGSVGSKAASIFSDVKSAGSTLLFAIIFSIYFLLDSGISKYWKRVGRKLLSRTQIDKMKAFSNDADKVFSGYIRGQALDALIMGTCVSIAFIIAGVPYGAVIGILTGMGNLIPFVGPIIGFASLIITCLATGAFSKLLIGAIILVLMLAIDGNLINPKLLSANVKVHPILVFLALIAGGQVGGIVGMLVAVPCAALIKQQFEKYVDSRQRSEDE